MANYANLLATIAANIYTNGNNEVTAAMVEAACAAMVTQLGAGYQFIGVADTSTTPPNSPDYKCFYLASEAGTYTDFLDINADPLKVTAGELAVLKYDTAWSKELAEDTYLSTNLLLNYDINRHPLKKENIPDSSTNPNWHSFFSIPVSKGDTIIYERPISTSLISSYSYYIITDTSGNVIARKDGTGSDAPFSFTYTMASDGFVSLCFYEDGVTPLPRISSSQTHIQQQLSEVYYQNLLAFADKDTHPLKSDNTLATITASSWRSYYKVRASTGDVLEYRKITSTSLLSGYSYIIITDTSGNVLTRKDGTGSDSPSVTRYTMPSDGFVSVCFYDDGQNSVRLLSKLSAILSELVNDSGTDAETILSPFRSIYKFGVIGDSLSVGHMKNPVDDVVTYRNIPFSWPQILARKNGQKCLNFGFSGASATSWWTDGTYLCPSKVSDPDNLCQAYIIGLGANPDAGGIGSISDIDWSNGNNNAATFYGQYARIVQLIRSVAPKAVIFCLTLPYPRESSATNNAIISIATNANVSDHTFVVDLVEKTELLQKWIVGSLVSPGNYSKFYYGSHFIAPGYAMVADMIEDMVSEVMNDNASDSVIRSIGNIPYGSNDIIP